ncbi:hypothetical protein EV121DRAFT_201025 [Schizophyllum commune]
MDNCCPGSDVRNAGQFLHEDSDLEVIESSQPLPVDPSLSTDRLDEITAFLDSQTDALRELNWKIHDNPELAYHEFVAHETLTSFMEDRGWAVTRGAYGIATAFVAVYDSGVKGPVVSFNAEYDCLKDIGHACGHNLIATASVAAALATAECMRRHSLAGKVVLYGTPAEEGGGGKIRLLDAGAYRDHGVDVSLMAHPGIVRPSALVRTAAYQKLTVEYFGKEAHAAASPWEGINALDGLITGYNAMSALRQQTMPKDVIGVNITYGGLAPNIIHAYAAAGVVVRSEDRYRLVELERRVRGCLEAGAAGSGAELKITTGGSYLDHTPNKALGRFYRHYFNRLGPKGPIPPPEVDWLTGFTSASTDQGNISYAMPSLHAGFYVESDAGPHTPKFTEAARTQQAHDSALMTGKALAATAVEVLSRKGLLKEIKEEWEKNVGSRKSQ